MRRNIDREIGVITVLSVVLFSTVVLLFPRETRASVPIVREVEYHPYIHEEINEVVRLRESIPVESVVSETTYILDVTDEERALMERVVMSEGSLLPRDGKQAIAQTIVNRVRSSRFPNNVEAVITQPYQYSTYDNGTPDGECEAAVEAALKYEGFPIDMYYFRTGHYHTFAEDYCQIGNTYFSTERSK